MQRRIQVAQLRRKLRLPLSKVNKISSAFLSLKKQENIDDLISTLQTKTPLKEALFNNLINIMMHYLIITWEMKRYDIRNLIKGYTIASATRELKTFFDESKKTLQLNQLNDIAENLLEGILSDDKDQEIENDAFIAEMVLLIEKKKSSSAFLMARTMDSYYEQKLIIAETLQNMTLDGKPLSKGTQEHILKEALEVRRILRQKSNEENDIVQKFHQNEIGVLGVFEGFKYQEYKKLFDDGYSDLGKAIHSAQDKFY